MRTRTIIHMVGCHAEGEIGDVIVGGVLPPAGATMFEKMQSMRREHDDIRKMLICEPRGSVARHVNLIVPPTRADCAAGVIIMEPTEYPPMSGSNTMCATTVLLETGMVRMLEPETRLRLDMPGGIVDIVAECRDGKCMSVEIANVPSFVDRLDAPLEIASLPTLSVDIAYGGMFFALVDADRLGFSIAPDEARDLALLGEKIRVAVRQQYRVTHPENPGIHGVSIVQFCGPFNGPDQVSRNTCIVAPGRADRSPTGTGTSARMAVLHARGLLKVNQTLIHESIIGSRFIGRIVGESRIQERAAVATTIKGRAYVTGIMNYFCDPADPYPSGFIVGDTWGVSTILSQV
jgi:trans-L-3-hydroxyproline dehydratase